MLNPFILLDQLAEADWLRAGESSGTGFLM